VGAAFDDGVEGYFVDFKEVLALLVVSLGLVKEVKGLLELFAVDTGVEENVEQDFVRFEDLRSLGQRVSALEALDDLTGVSLVHVFHVLLIDFKTLIIIFIFGDLFHSDNHLLLKVGLFETSIDRQSLIEI
jgi:hypothetical protein